MGVEDFKELIENLRALSPHVPEQMCDDDGRDALEKAATAIETLLAERDAAVEDLRGLCWCCVRGKKYENGLSWSRATTCEHMRELGVVARIGGKCKCQYWQWRGSKGGGSAA